MVLILTDGWYWFCIALAVVQLTTLIMSLQERHFFTQDVVKRKFTILDLQFAANAKEIAIIIKGMYHLPDEATARKAIRALKGQLYVDFLFMPAAYGGIFLLCMQVAGKMGTFGQQVFAALAWLQLIAWLCDIIENIYLLGKVRHDIEIPKDPPPLMPGQKPPKDAAFAFFRLLVMLKWGIALVAAVCAIFALIYFWLTGKYQEHSLVYALIILGQIIVFAVLGKLVNKKDPEKVKS